MSQASSFFLQATSDDPILSLSWYALTLVRYVGQTSHALENFDESRVPKNTALPLVSAAIAAAVRKYSSLPGLPDLPVVVLTVGV